MKQLTSLVTILFILFPGSVFAYKGDLYSGIMLSKITLESKPIDEFDDEGFKIKPTALLARFGGYLTDNIALEMRFGTSAEVHTEHVEGEFGDQINIDSSVNTIYGLYVVFSTLNDDPGYYAFIGHTSAELVIDDEEDGAWVDKDHDTSFGMGFRYGALTLEYIQYIDEKEYEASGLNIGLTATF